MLLIDLKLGTKCTVYVMDLHYQAVYRLYPVNTFYLPESHNDLRRLVDAYEGMAQLTVSNRKA